MNDKERTRVLFDRIGAVVTLFGGTLTTSAFDDIRQAKVAVRVDSDESTAYGFGNTDLDALERVCWIVALDAERDGEPPPKLVVLSLRPDAHGAMRVLPSRGQIALRHVRACWKTMEE